MTNRTELKSKHTSVRLQPSIKQLVQRAAADECRSVNNHIENLIKEDLYRRAARLPDHEAVYVRLTPDVHADLHEAATAAYREGHLSYADFYAVDVWLAHSRRWRRRPAR